MSYFRQAAIIIFVVLLLRLPFLTQAVQGDDPYYLKGAEHALIDPLHPSHARYIFQGDLVDMRGHPHPPLNSWMLAGLLAICGDVREVPFHAAYALFSLIAALSMLAIARRYVPEHALAATLLFVVTPAFVVNGNSFEADLPLLAFWMAAIAMTLEDRYALAAVASALAALTGYQAGALLLLLPLLKRTRASLIPALAAPAAIAGYNLFERFTNGALPAQVLAGYMGTYQLQTKITKLHNAGALIAHLGWLTFPLLAIIAFRRQWIVGLIAAAAAAFYDIHPIFWISFAAGAMLLAHCLRDWREPLTQWILLFFAAALAIFFAGSARYLLPIAAPVAILVAARVPRLWNATGIAASAVVSLGLAIVNYQHWDAYRTIEHPARRAFTNAEWGLRYYLESKGARAIVKGQTFWPRDVLITTALAHPPENAIATSVETREITSPIPLRIVALGTRSNYSSYFNGLRPFDISTAPIDRVTIAVTGERKVEFSQLKIGTPEAASQIISGVFNADHWMTDRASLILKRPANATTLDAMIFIPPQTPARTIALEVDGKPVAKETYSAPGVYKLSISAPAAEKPVVTLTADKTFSSPPDTRRLAVVLLEIGFH